MLEKIGKTERERDGIETEERDKGERRKKERKEKENFFLPKFHLTFRFTGIMTLSL